MPGDRVGHLQGGFVKNAHYSAVARGIRGISLLKDTDVVYIIIGYICCTWATCFAACVEQCQASSHYHKVEKLARKNVFFHDVNFPFPRDPPYNIRIILVNVCYCSKILPVRVQDVLSANALTLASDDHRFCCNDYKIYIQLTISDRFLFLFLGVMKRLLLIACTLVSFSVGKSQDTISYSVPVTAVPDSVPVDVFAIGVGGGYEFGGIGANVLYYPTRGLGVFAGGGYTLIGFGYNVGVKLRIVVDQTAAEFMPYLIAMYGYNATINYPSFPEKNMTFYGATVGAGIDYRPGNSKFGYLSASVYVPIRSTGVKDYVNNESYFYGIPYSTGRIFPLSVAIGYRFIFKNNKIEPVKVISP